MTQDIAFRSSATSITIDSGTCRCGTWADVGELSSISTSLIFHSGKVEEEETAGTKGWNSATLT